MPEEFVPIFQRFTRGPTLLRQSLDGLGPAVMNRPGPEGWSIRDIIIHLADTELARGERIRRVLAEDSPAIQDIDEGLWKRRLHYLWRSPDATLALFELLCFTNAEILRECDLAAWQRSAIHSTDGRITLGDLLRRGADHVEEHVRQITALRAR